MRCPLYRSGISAARGNSAQKGREERHLSKSLLLVGCKVDFMKAGSIMPPSISLAVPGHRHLGDASVVARLLPVRRVGNLLIPQTKPIWVRRVLPNFVI